MNRSERAKTESTNLAILASGSGSNAQKICQHLKDHPSLRVTVIISNKEEAGVKKHAKSFGVPFLHFSNDDFKSGNEVLNTLQEMNIQGIILAGFLRKIPSALIRSYPDKILNIHPALLPKYGGKGMYGIHVHRAVKEAGEAFSGPTIHVVNEKYDDGKVVFQAKVALERTDEPEDIGKKVLALEHTYYPRVVEAYFGGLGKKA